MATAPSSQVSLLLQKQLKNLCKHPVDEFSAGLVNEDNIFEWNVTFIGPPDTLYEGGFFNAIMSFPEDYPCNPPIVCVSILHPPGDDPNGYEFATERWNPVHTNITNTTSLCRPSITLTLKTQKSARNIISDLEALESQSEAEQRCLR
ncbi:unnamed protein product [Malus baccata var. baccata]